MLGKRNKENKQVKDSHWAGFLPADADCWASCPVPCVAELNPPGLRGRTPELGRLGHTCWKFCISFGRFFLTHLLVFEISSVGFSFTRCLPSAPPLTPPAPARRSSPPRSPPSPAPHGAAGPCAGALRRRARQPLRAGTLRRGATKPACCCRPHGLAAL